MGWGRGAGGGRLGTIDTLVPLGVNFVHPAPHPHTQGNPGNFLGPHGLWGLGHWGPEARPGAKPRGQVP